MRLIRHPFLLFLLSAVSIWLVGCGGGGGGNNKGSGVPGQLNLFANFTPGTAGGPFGTSEVIKVTTQSGTPIKTQTVSSPGLYKAPTQVTIPLSNGNYLCTVTLFSGTGGTGTAIGTVSAAFTVSSANEIQSISTAMGQSISSVQVGPVNSVVSQGGTQQMVATALDSNNDLVFESGQPTWSVVNSPSVGSINSQGLFTGTGPGLATVQAAYGSVTSTCSVSVTAMSSGTWTIMLFLNSANDLDAESLLNIKQIEQVAQAANSQTRFLVQWKLTDDTGTDIPQHPFNGTRRFLALNGNLEFLQDLGSGVDMGSPVTLKNFVNWGVQNYPAQHYMLVMWDHGNGWFMNNALPSHAPRWRGISYDFETGNHIDVTQIAQSVSPNHLDIISFDACLMQMLEIQDQLSGVANYMVCSEDNTPGPGYPYNTAFGSFFTSPTAPTVTLAKSIVDAFITDYDADPNYNSTPLSHSVVDLSKVAAVTGAVNNFSSALLASGNSVGLVSPGIRSNLINYAAGDGYNYYDLGAIAQAYASQNVSAGVTQAANAVVTAEQAAVLYSKTDGHSPNSSGISIEFGSSGQYDQYSSDYGKLVMAQQTHWPQFLGSSVANP